MEYSVIDNCLMETPEKRSRSLSSVRDALVNMLHTESRGAYLSHYNSDDLAAILTAIKATTENRAEADVYYQTLDRPLHFHLISINAETRTKTETDTIQELIDMPVYKIHEAVRKLSV